MTVLRGLSSWNPTFETPVHGDNDDETDTDDDDDVDVHVALSVKTPATAVAALTSDAGADATAGRGAPASAAGVGMNPELEAGFLSMVFFTWVNPLFNLSRKKRRQGEELEESDLWPLIDSDTSEVLGDKFQMGWDLGMDRLREKHGGNSGDEPLEASESEAYGLLLRALWFTCGRSFVKTGAVKFVNSCFQFSFPFLLDQILTFIQEADSRPVYEGYVWVAALITGMVARSLTENNYFFRAVRVSYQARSCVTTMVYRKSLRLSSSARQGKTIGEIVNVMQLDATKIEQFGMQVHAIWDGVLQIAGYLTLLYFYIGWATFVGLGTMLASIPINIIVMSRLFKIVNKMVVVTDSRVKVTNEVLQGMLGIKMAAWEENFVGSIEGMRKHEVKLLRGTVYLRGFVSSFIAAMPAITASCAIAVYALNGGDIDASTLFVAISAFNALRIPLLILPQAIAAFVQFRVSARRVANFLALEEVEAKAVANKRTKANSGDGGDHGIAIRVSDGDFFWSNPRTAVHATAAKAKEEASATSKSSKSSRRNKNSNSGKAKKNAVVNSVAPADVAGPPTPVLSGVNCNIQAGKITAVIGPVGSGKSSFCNAILGEMFMANGSIDVNGPVAYAAQTPWIQNATLRDNVLFGEPFEEERYWQVLDACQLTHDLDILQAGDMTMIGERGINLSGGQKQRISVARAAYSKRSIVILDDPLSALDPGVANKMFKECVVRFMSGRTRVLVTNQLNFLKSCDWVVVLTSQQADSAPASIAIDDKSEAPTGSSSGRIAEQGTFKELNNAGLDFAELLARFGDAAGHRNSTDGPAAGGIGEGAQADHDEDNNNQMNNNNNNNNKADRAEDKIPDELMQTEERNRGAVRFHEYSHYIKSGGGWLVFLFIYLFFLIAQGAQVLNVQWVSFWTRSAAAQYEDFDIIDVQVDAAQNETIGDSNVPLVFYVVGYAGTAVLIAIVSFIRTVLMNVFGLNASVKLHEALLMRILGAPMSFFDTTPIGRIISRFSKDLYQIDNEVAQFFQFFLLTTTAVVSTLVVIAFITPLFAIAIPFLAFAYFYVLQIFRPVARDMKRLEAISRSPIYAHFSETLGGLSTIRAYGEAHTFALHNAAKVNRNICDWYWMRTGDRWLGIRLEFLGASVAALAALLAVYSATNEGGLDASQAGVSLTFASSLTVFLTFTVRSFAELESGMVSVSRITYYSTNVVQEAERHSRDPPPNSWPHEGTIVVKDLKMRYRPTTPLVLKGVSFTIQGGQRVGVVGRTGSGKSSLMLCLLRLVEPEAAGADGRRGPISLDGVDISKIGLAELRRKVSIVPQSPVIFSGTVRSNLDPFNQYSDAQIWMALTKCNLKQMVTEYPEKLEHTVSEYGENFSQGQRQLLCLARALLEKSKVLLLDEATSSVDFETDAIIQQTIRSEDSFGGCTILTIAHRINTVIDNDKILVLDSGTVAEYDAPQTLLANPDSVLSSMVSGKEASPKDI